jgi:hypothetical protein
MFEFMKHLVVIPEPDKVYPLYANVFCRVDQSEVELAEQALKSPLPEQLRAFYLEIGEGQLQTGSSGAVSDNNLVAAPSELIEIINGTSEWLMPYSQIEPNTLPFFQRGVDSFLCLKPRSDNPNAVWHMWGELMPNGGKICDSLVEFFERLVEDPNWFNPPKA